MRWACKGFGVAETEGWGAYFVDIVVQQFAVFGAPTCLLEHTDNIWDDLRFTVQLKSFGVLQQTQGTQMGVEVTMLRWFKEPGVHIGWFLCTRPCG